MNGPDEEVVDESSLTERYLVDAIAPLTRHKKTKIMPKKILLNRIISPPQIKPVVMMEKVKIRLRPVGHTGTYGLDPLNASGKLTSTWVGEILPEQVAS